MQRRGKLKRGNLHTSTGHRSAFLEAKQELWNAITQKARMGEGHIINISHIILLNGNSSR